MKYVSGLAKVDNFNRQHVQLHLFEASSLRRDFGQTTDIEVHFMASRMNCPWNNRRLQKSFAVKGQEYECLKFGDDSLELCVPITGVNIVCLFHYFWKRTVNS